MTDVLRYREISLADEQQIKTLIQSAMDMRLKNAHTVFLSLLHDQGFKIIRVTEPSIPKGGTPISEKELRRTGE